MPVLTAALALHRFGVGAKPGELAGIEADGREFLKRQLAAPQAALLAEPGLPTSAEAARALARAQRTSAPRARLPRRPPAWTCKALSHRTIPAPFGAPSTWLKWRPVCAMARRRTPGPPGMDRPDSGAFGFFAGRHESGAFTVMGRTYPQTGVVQGEAVLQDLAVHPATARHLARKLAAHFIADDPPDAAVQPIEAAFRETDGDLAHVAAALVDCPEAWEPKPRKLKSPYDFVLSASRAQPDYLGDPGGLLRAFVALGQRPFAPPSPKGFEDTTASWLAPHSFKERLEWSTQAASKAPPNVNPALLADDLFGPLLSKKTRDEVARAADAAQGMALLLMSPEFQRR